MIVDNDLHRTVGKHTAVVVDMSVVMVEVTGVMIVVLAIMVVVLTVAMVHAVFLVSTAESHCRKCGAPFSKGI